jgi:hypothetical protein
MTKLVKEKDAERIHFNDWNWGDWDLNAEISKRVAEVLTEELEKEPPVCFFSSINDDDPLRIVVKWPFSDDTFFEASLRDLVREEIESNTVDDVQRIIDALRSLADDGEKWITNLNRGGKR